MEIKYPWLIFVAIGGLIFVWIWHKYKPGKDGSKNKTIANTSLVKNTPSYKEIARKYYLILYGILGVFSACVICIAVLSARVVVVKNIDNKIYNRDIILCMDVSTSMNMVNHRIAETYDDIVKAMNGERFGISVFNGRSLLRVPLTDDYEFVSEELDEAKRVYSLIGDEEEIDYDKLSSEERKEVESYLFSGTLSDDDSSSKTGDGLASCVYDFPDYDKERSRIVILSSDNEIYGKQLINVTDAAKIAKKKNIKVYALAPTAENGSTLATPEKAKELRDELGQAVALTGGKLYIVNSGNEVSEIVREIEKTEKTLLEGTKKTAETDYPEVLYVLTLVALVVSLIMMRLIK